jgi:hypothetical protein
VLRNNFLHADKTLRNFAPSAKAATVLPSMFSPIAKWCFRSYGAFRCLKQSPHPQPRGAAGVRACRYPPGASERLRNARFETEDLFSKLACTQVRGGGPLPESVRRRLKFLPRGSGELGGCNTKAHMGSGGYVTTGKSGLSFT